MDIFGVPIQALLGQVLIGLINGGFYAILSLGLALIFGLLNIINFAHGAVYTAGAFVAWLLLEHLGIGYWGALLFAPGIIALIGIFLEKTLVSQIYRQDHLYGLLLTYVMALIFEVGFRQV